MKALLYMSKRNMINRLKTATKKPATLVGVIVLTAYFVFLAVMGIAALVEAEFETTYFLLAALTLWTFYSFFMNFASYAKRKGVIFKPSHAHFIFTAPISPKIILLYGAAYNFLLSLLIAVLFIVAGVVGFHISIGTALVLFIALFVLESILEGSIIIFLYANEFLSEKVVKLLARAIYLLLGGVTLFGVWYFKTEGITLNSVIQLIDFPALQMLPIVGWNIALFRLILLGPTTLNLVCSGLYIMTVLFFGVVAWRMKCQGGYYEDAAKFADDYAEMKARKNSGEMVMSIGKKKRFKKATVNYKATGAKAIFYRQLLEYKKEKWFIFSYMTVFCIAADILVIRVIPFSNAARNGLALLGIAAYMAIVTGGYMGKWDKELKNPYLYLLPDSPAKKMWYATAMEHVKAAIDGMILVVPIGIAWGVNLYQMVCIWLMYIMMQAIKLYTKVLIDSLLGSVLGETAKQLLRMAVQGGIMGIGAIIGVVLFFAANLNVVFPVVLIYGIIMTVVIGLLTVSRFTIMEQLD